MSNTLNTTLGLDISNWVASAKTAGDVTDREFTKMQRLVKALNQNLADMNKYGKEAANSPKALEKTAKELEHVGFASSGAKRELIVLAHELSQGNYSRFGGSMMVLAERTNAAELAFSALGIGVLATTAVVGGFVAAIIMGHHEQSVFNNSLIATGNAAGMTADSFNALAAASAAVSGSTIGHGKESLQDLVATGRIYPEVIGIATQASINLQRVTGQSAEEVAKDFGKMGDDVAKWAMEHNKHMHFVSAAQFKYIKELSDAGKSSEAAAETLKLLNAQVQTQTIDIGNLEAGWIKFTQALSAAKDVMMGWGKKNIHGETLDNLLSQLKQAQVAAELANSGSPTLAGMLGRKQNAERIASLSAEIAKQRELMRFEDQAANQKAKSAEIAEKAIAKMMKKVKPGTKESHDPLESRLDSFRQSELSSQAATNEALRTGNLKAYETARADAIKQEEEFAKIVGSAHVKDNIRAGNHSMDFETARANAITDYFRDVGDQTKRAEGLVTGSFTRMEDAIVNFAKTGKLSFSDLFGFMAEEFIRNQIKMAEKSLLTDSAGSFIGIGAMAKGAAAFFGIPGFANGLDYVPHDNYPAMLHEGERVLTRQDAANGSARGGINIDGSITIGSVGAGTSRAEVFAAVQQASAQTKASIMRTLKQQGVTA